MIELAPTNIVSDDLPVKLRLHDFGLTKTELEKICEAVVYGRNLKSELQPKTSEGQFKYIYGVEGMREVTLSSEHIVYEVFSKNNIEGVFDAANGRKIMFQIVDKACSTSAPQPKSKIGEAKRKLIEKSNQRFLFPEMEEEENKKVEFLTALDRADSWYVMVSIDDNDTINCEISRPKNVIDGVFSGFYERVWVFKDGEFASSEDANQEDDTYEIKPKITKKK